MINLSDSQSRTVEIEVTGLRHDLVRTSHCTIKVDYSGWNKAMQQISRLGGKIAKVTVLSSPLDTAHSHSPSQVAGAIAAPDRAPANAEIQRPLCEPDSAIAPEPEMPPLSDAPQTAVVEAPAASEAISSLSDEALAPISHASDSASVTLPVPETESSGDRSAVPEPETTNPEAATGDRSTQSRQSKTTSQSSKAKKTTQSTKAKKGRKSKSSES